MFFDDENADPSKKNKKILRWCGVCDETKHNAQTCLNNIKSFDKSKSD